MFPHFGIIELTILIEGDDMLTKYTPKNREQLEMITLDQLVPENHLVRKVEATIDFSFIYSLVEDAYLAERGRPSIDPVVLIKMTFIQYMFGIRSVRKTIEEIETNLAYRWFLGFWTDFLWNSESGSE